MNLTIPYSFDQILQFKNAQVPSVKHTGLVRFIHWCEILVQIATDTFVVMEGWVSPKSLISRAVLQGGR